MKRIGVHLNGTQGITLVEISIAIVIFILMILPVLRVFTSGSQSVLKHREYANAVLIAQDTLEICRGYDFDFMAAESQTDPELKRKTLEQDFSDAPGAVDNYSRQLEFSGTVYTREVDIKPVSSDGKYKLNVVRVTVTWKDRKGHDRKYEVYTTIAKRS